ncbi:hypothetical protein AAFF_G00422180 [Aldrovandia affinis]|uniref:ribonuclease H n=1 Tax=Aldrovandia affinis TaxID=143900 RepID=A0AAD7VYI4_9TELE|nr:hypothetical protein AAFF_G00422180 [Aldrovandia affinis]
MHAVALKLPEFWQEHAAVWFAQAEAQFALRGITQEDTKYFYVVAALNSSTASRVLSLLQDPPEDDKYLALKQLLLETFELSEPERARKLLTLPDAQSSACNSGRFPVKDLRALAREADKVLNSSRMPGPAVRVVGAADVQAIREDVIAATQRQRPTAGLCYYDASLLVDVRNRRLVNAETFATLPGSPSSTGTSKLSSALSSADMFQRLLMDFPDLTTPTFSSAAVKHGVDHFIATTGPPVHARARRLDPQKLAVAKAEFDSMERLGIVHDILVASVTSDEHQAHLRALFARLSEHGLIINLAKCQFGVPVVDFLGHRVTREAKAVGIRLEFTTDIQHAAGKDNVVADCLSRSIVDAVNLGVDYGQMAADQASDPEVQVLRAATTGLQLQEGDAWFDTLPWVLLGLRTAPKADLGASSAELVYGQPLHVPGEFLPSCSVPWSATRQLPVLRDGLKSSPLCLRHITVCPAPHVHPALKLTLVWVLIRPGLRARDWGGLAV